LSIDTHETAKVVIAARTGIHSSNEHKVRRKGDATLCTTDGNYLVLQGLTQHLEVGLSELRKLIEKEHATMAQAYLARPGPSPAADQSGMWSK